MMKIVFMDDVKKNKWSDFNDNKREIGGSKVNNT